MKIIICLSLKIQTSIQKILFTTKKHTTCFQSKIILIIIYFNFSIDTSNERLTFTPTLNKNNINNFKISKQKNNNIQSKTNNNENQFKPIKEFKKRRIGDSTSLIKPNNNINKPISINNTYNKFINESNNIVNPNISNIINQRNNNSVNTSKIDLNFSEKIVCPKSDYKFSYNPLNYNNNNNNNNIKRSKSQQKFNSNKKNNNNITLISNSSVMNNNNTSIYSSIDNYWQRRQNETQNKLNNIRNEEFQKEQCELQKKPKISKNSIKIAKKLRQYTVNNNNNNNVNEDVFSRLTNKKYIEKHNEEIKRLSELNNKNHSPNINESSKLMKRTIEDLYTWQNIIDRKKSEAKNYIDSQENKTNLYTNLKSDKILMNRKPDYINKKVEDRLLEQGEINKMKLEEQKEHYIENVTAKCLYNNNNYNKNSYNQIKSRYFNLDNYKTIPSKRNSNRNNNKNNKKIESVRNRKKKINLYNNNEEEKLNKTQENIKLNINRIRNPRQKSEPNLPVFGNKTQQEIINIREQTALKANKFINNYNNNNSNYNNNLYKLNNTNQNELNNIRKHLNNFYDNKFGMNNNNNNIITTDNNVNINYNMNNNNNIVTTNNNNLSYSLTGNNENYEEEDKINNNIPVKELPNNNYKPQNSININYNFNKEYPKDNLIYKNKVPLSNLTQNINRNNINNNVCDSIKLPNNNNISNNYNNNNNININFIRNENNNNQNNSNIYIPKYNFNQEFLKKYQNSDSFNNNSNFCNNSMPVKNILNNNNIIYQNNDITDNNNNELTYNSQNNNYNEINNNHNKYIIKNNNTNNYNNKNNNINFSYERNINNNNNNNLNLNNNNSSNYDNNNSQSFNNNKRIQDLQNIMKYASNLPNSSIVNYKSLNNNNGSDEFIIESNENTIRK